MGPVRSGDAGRLAGKVAVVTGGASGIGLATSTLLADEGARVLVVDLDAERGGRVASELEGRYVQADVGDPSHWDAVVAAVGVEGRLDLVHLNAGVTTGEADLTRLTDAQYRRIMGPNVDGVVFGVRALAPLIARSGGGALVATASLAGLIAFSPDPVYTMTKHAVVGLVRALAPQLGAQGITVNAVCPGLVDTPLLGEEARVALEAAGFPIIDPHAIAEAVLSCMLGSETGQAWVCQAGRPPVSYRFNGVPGPLAEGAEGAVPPEGLVAHDQRPAEP